MVTGSDAGEMEKSPALAPPRPSPETTRSAVPVLVMVRVCAALLVFTNWLPKLTGSGAAVIAGATPVPLSGTEWGLPAALSLIRSDAERFPVTDGVKVTSIVTLAPVVIDSGSVPALNPKSGGLLPARSIADITSWAAPSLVMVICLAVVVVPTNWCPKARIVGEIPKAGAVPVPDSGMLCGFPAALSVMTRLADRWPSAVGANVMLTVVLAPGGSAMGGAEAVNAKSEACRPASATLETSISPSPTLVIVTTVGELVVLTG